MTVLIHYDSIDLGGMQTYLVTLSKKLVEKGLTVIFCYNYGVYFKTDLEKYTTLIKLGPKLISKAYLKSPRTFIINYLNARKILKAFNPTSIFVSNLNGVILFGLHKLKPNDSLIWIIGGSIKQVHKTYYKLRLGFFLDSLVTRYLSWPEVFKELKYCGANPNKFTELPNAVDCDHFKPIRKEVTTSLKKKLGIKNNALIIGWVGRVALNMQIWNTLDLVHRLLKEDKLDIHFLCVGGGPDLGLLRKKIDRLMISNSVTITDWIPYDHMPEYINCMDIVPLLEKDPQGGSILRETMACGRVAISVDGTSRTQRRFINGENGVLVSEKDFIRNAVEWIKNYGFDQLKNSEIGEKARKSSIDYMSFDKQARIVFDLITGLTKNNK